MSAWNLKQEDLEEYLFQQQAKKKKAESPEEANALPEEYKGSKFYFSRSLDNVNSHLTIMRYALLDGFTRFVNSLKKIATRKEEALFLIILSSVVYGIGFFVQKKFVRVQIMIWLLSAGFLMWFGFRFHTTVVSQIKGCLAGFDLADHGLDFEDFFKEKKPTGTTGENMFYDMGNACITERASGNMVKMFNREDRQSFEWGIKILRGFSHDLSFLK